MVSVRLLTQAPKTLKGRLLIPIQAAANCLAIEMVGIRAGYSRLPVLTDLSLQVRYGEMVGIAGPNGAGKTTLLRVMMGLIVPDAGLLRLLDHPIDSGHRRRWLRRRVGYVAQEHAAGALPITVLDAVLLGRWGRTYAGWRRPDADDRRAAGQWLERVGMGSQLHKDVRELSGGQRQRVALARALVGTPQLLILDEPTTHLDIQVRTELIQLILKLHRDENLTTVLVSHEEWLLQACADRILVLNNGSLGERPLDQAEGCRRV